MKCTDDTEIYGGAAFLFLSLILAVAFFIEFYKALNANDILEFAKAVLAMLVIDRLAPIRRVITCRLNMRNMGG